MKILHLEDNPHDADLTCDVLVDQWPGCEIDVVDSRENFVAQLAGRHDLILSDFSMPHFSGLAALELAQTRLPDTPFIFLSGTIGEERAVDALRSGANDYVLKDRPQRLVPAVRRALADADRVRERLQVESHLAEVRRLENIRQLVSAVAHDLNNALSPIFMGAPYLQAKLEPEDQKICEILAECGKKSAALVRHLSAMTADTSGEAQLLDLKEVMHGMVTILHESFPAGIDVKSEIAPDLRSITAHRAHIHQILFNLCLEARAAMKSGEGTLCLRAMNLPHDARIENGPADLPSGDYVLLEVSNSGAGNPPEASSNPWKPALVRKNLVRPSWFDLPTIRGMVANYRGVTAVCAQPAWGATHRIFLPAESAA